MENENYLKQLFQDIQFSERQTPFSIKEWRSLCEFIKKQKQEEANTAQAQLIDILYAIAGGALGDQHIQRNDMTTDSFMKLRFILGYIEKGRLNELQQASLQAGT